jgi:hypothetical protein
LTIDPREAIWKSRPVRERLNPIAAAIFVVWGAALLISGATGYSPHGAFVSGLILLGLGLAFLMRRRSSR